MPLVSVIIPIYNVEKWLATCLDSVCTQTLKDIEIICVNDGSRDNCVKICKEYTSKDKRLRVIHKSNGGLSSARNAGINVAKGKYIYFIDPDDNFNPDMLFKMVNIAEQKHCQVVLCGYKTIPEGNVVIPLFEPNKPINPKEMIINNHRVHSHNDLCFTWRFLFDANTIIKNNIRFNEKVFVGEDTIFNLEVLLKAQKAYVFDLALYYYTINNDSSIMRTPFKEHLESSFVEQYAVKKKLSIEFRLNKSRTYMDDMAFYYINNYLPMMIKNIFNGCEMDKKAGVKRILSYEMFRDSCKQIGFSYKFNSFKEFLFFLAIKYKIYPVVFYVFNKKTKLRFTGEINN